MKVLIVEDNKVHLETIKNKLLGIQISLSVDFDIIIPKTYQEVLDINSNSKYVINIIDIIDDKDHSFNGVDLAEKIKNLTRTSYIIFLTSYKHYLNAAVNKNVEPLAYISKSDPNLEKLLTNAFRRILYSKLHFENNKQLEFVNEDNDKIFISINNILMLYTHPEKQNYIILESRSKKYIFKGKISQQVHLHDNLVKCNKSTVINKQKISRITKGTTPKNKIIILEQLDNRQLPEILLSTLYKKNLL